MNLKWYVLSIILFIGKYIHCQTCTSLDAWPIVKANWSSCPIRSDGTLTANNVYAECMFLTVPIDWSSSNLTTCSSTIEIFVKRYFVSGHQNTSHHVWRIPGGGGIPISTLEFEAMSVVNALSGSVSIYLTDKRGVGRSSLLECPTSIVANFTNCLPFIEQNQYRLKHNTYTNTAYDLEYVLNVIMGKNRENIERNQRVILMASSQGTYLVQRYLLVTENAEQVDGVIFDSILPTDATILTHGDKHLNYVFLDLFGRCAQNQQDCAGYFEDENPLRALYSYKMNEDLLDQSSCLYLLNTSTTELANKMSFILYPQTMPLLPALIFRINRCNDNDQRVLKHFLNATQPPEQDAVEGFSILVEINNNLAELWSSLDTSKENDSSCEYLKGVSMNTFASTHVMPDTYCPIQQTGQLGYPTDEFYRKYPTKKTQLPVLLLHGDMDQALPVSIPRHFAKQYSRVNSKFTYIELPRTGHTPTSASPTSDEAVTCGWSLAITFIQSETFEADRSCLKKINEIDFGGKTSSTKQVALQYFGTDDIWNVDKSSRGNIMEMTVLSYVFGIIFIVIKHSA
ncbi:unnamed protein product [Adineta ricciae]|uniref:Uncharacterized protein n=1 Tax=Adineta ricciae TaxID=249248 RepID=A0A814HUN6_ADIRI|nr:unnamed protein product [Adineta ricciae]